MTGQLWTAGDLVESRRCTPQCLLALNAKCTCHCGNRTWQHADCANRHARRTRRESAPW